MYCFTFSPIFSVRLLSFFLIWLIPNIFFLKLISSTFIWTIFHIFENHFKDTSKLAWIDIKLRSDMHEIL